MKQLQDQVNVWTVIDAGANSVIRELVLVKVSSFPPSHALSPVGASAARGGFHCQQRPPPPQASPWGRSSR